MYENSEGSFHKSFTCTNSVIFEHSRHFSTESDDSLLGFQSNIVYENKHDHKVSGRFNNVSKMKLFLHYPRVKILKLACEYNKEIKNFPETLFKEQLNWIIELMVNIVRPSRGLRHAYIRKEIISLYILHSIVT